MSISSPHTVCDPFISETDKINLMQKYHPNPVIRAVAKLDEPFVNSCVFRKRGTPCEDGKGINFEIFDLIMKALELNYTLTKAEDGETGYYYDGKWHGMVSQLLRNEVDMTATIISITDERLKAVDFSSPVNFYWKGFLVHRPNAIDAAAVPTFLATPFRLPVWTCFIVSLVLYIFLAYIFRLFLTPTPQRRPLQFLADSALNIIRIPLSQVDPPTENTAIRVVLSTLVIPTFFLMNFYTASLTGTLMFMGDPPIPFHGLKEVAHLIRDKKLTLITIGSKEKYNLPPQSIPMNEKDPEMMLRRASVYNPPVTVETLEEAARMVDKNSSLIFWGSYNQVLDAASYSCNLQVIDDTHSAPMWLAFAFRKDDPLQYLISRTLYSFTTVDSFMKRMYAKYTKHQHCPNATNGNGKGKGEIAFPLGIRQLQGAFFLVLYGIMLAGLAFLIEIILIKILRRRYIITGQSVKRLSGSSAQLTHVSCNV